MKNNFKLQRIILLTGIMLISCFPAIGQIDENYRENVEKAFAAKSTAECQSSLKFCNGVLKVFPHHPAINYLAARLNAVLGNSDIALGLLKKATIFGYTTKDQFYKMHHLNDSAFSILREETEFDEILKALKKAEKPIHKSQIAFIINDKELNPEGITYDPVEEVFYLGSMSKHKIVKVDHFGKSIDFTSEKQDGLGSLRGIHVDSFRRTLWVCSHEESRDEIFKYNLSTGRLIKKYLLPPDGIRHNFNDLVIHPNGDVYITDNTRSGAIFIIPFSSDKLELFLKDKSFVHPNGITLSENGRVIYLGVLFVGIYEIDIKTKFLSPLSNESGLSTFGIDGLYYANNSLYAVQNLLNTISKFSLNKNAANIEASEIFERNTPYLYSPTTGVIVNDYFYFLADIKAKAHKQEGVIVMKASLK